MYEYCCYPRTVIRCTSTSESMRRFVHVFNSQETQTTEVQSAGARCSCCTSVAVNLPLVMSLQKMPTTHTHACFTWSQEVGWTMGRSVRYVPTGPRTYPPADKISYRFTMSAVHVEAHEFQYTTNQAACVDHTPDAGFSGLAKMESPPVSIEDRSISPVPQVGSCSRRCCASLCQIAT